MVPPFGVAAARLAMTSPLLIVSTVPTVTVGGLRSFHGCRMIEAFLEVGRKRVVGDVLAVL